MAESSANTQAQVAQRPDVATAAQDNQPRAAGRSDRWHLALLAIATLVVGALRFGNGFVYDDIHLLVQSDFVYAWSNVPSLFVNNTMFASDGGAYAATAAVDTYRPLTMLTFFVDGAIGGGAPWAFHLGNQVGHLIFVTLLWAALRRQLPEVPKSAVTVAALVIALHPVLAEAQVWINGRSDIWAGVFTMLVLWLWPRETPSPARLMAIAAALFAAMLCKEVALFTVPALLLWTAARSSALDSSRALRAGVVGAARVVAAPAIAVVLYLAARSLALGGMKAGGSALDLVAVAQRVPVLWWDALATLLAPRTLMMRHLAEAYAELPVAVVAVAAAGALALGGAALSSLRRRPELAVGLGWYAATLAPAVLVSFTPGWAGFGRYLYLPSVGVAIALLSLVPTVQASTSPVLQSVRRLAPLLAGIYVVAFALLTTLVTLNYNSNLSFYMAIAEEQPNRAHGHRGVGETLLGMGQPELAIPSLQQAIALQPSLRRPHVNLAKSLAQLGRFEEAEAASLAGLARFEANPNLWQILSMSRMSLGRGDAVTPLLNAREIAGDAPWLEDYVAYLLRDAPTEFLVALEAEAQSRDPELAERLQRARAASEVSE